MKTRYIPAVTMLSAGAVVSITSIIKQWDVLYSLKLLLGVLIVFYIIGLIAKAMITRTLEKDGRPPEEYVEETDAESEEGQETDEGNKNPDSAETE
ncbi:MAG: hypothetical protein ACOCM4_04525 [Acetivibrio ethanolgignens]